MNATITPMRTAAESALNERFSALVGAIPADGPLREMRSRAFAPIARLGLPTRRTEAYKYTDLRALMRDAPAPAQAVAAPTHGTSINWSGAHLFRFVNGHATSMPALPPGVEILTLAEALKAGHAAVRSRLGKEMQVAEGDALAGLNTAFMQDGLFIHVPTGVVVEKPLLLAFETQADRPVSVYPRLVVVVEAGARLTLVESHSGPADVAYHSNSAVEISIGDSARVEHVRLYGESNAALSFSTLAASLGAHAEFNTLAFAAGPQTARHQVFLTFAGRDARAGVRGVSLLRGSQHADHTLNVDHAEPGGVSRELFRAVLDEEATGVFQGKIVVRKLAQKTDGRMASNALMLSDRATMNNKPELEIFADDVQCAHGATCGALDENLLFYLMARGIPRREAEALMIESFAGEAIETIENEELRALLNGHVERWLRQRA